MISRSRDAVVLVLRLVAVAVFVAACVRAVREPDNERRREKLLQRLSKL